MSDEEIYKVDTVPPPDGEGDVYNAATRVGAPPPVAVLDAMKEAARSGNPLKPQAVPKGLSVPPAPGVPSFEAAAAAPSATPAADAPSTELGTPSFGTSVARLAIALAVVVVVFLLIGR